ncbi:MAG: hypothetical protein WB767_09090 [Nocardioides sp.]
MESDGNGIALLLLAGPLGGIAVYAGLFQFYRNTGKSHSFESETRVETDPVTGNDRKIDELRGTKRSDIKDGNVSNHRERVRRL